MQCSRVPALRDEPLLRPRGVTASCPPAGGAAAALPSRCRGAVRTSGCRWGGPALSPGLRCALLSPRRSALPGLARRPAALSAAHQPAASRWPGERAPGSVPSPPRACPGRRGGRSPPRPPPACVTPRRPLLPAHHFLPSQTGAGEAKRLPPSPSPSPQMPFAAAAGLLLQYVAAPSPAPPRRWPGAAAVQRLGPAPRLAAARPRAARLAGGGAGTPTAARQRLTTANGSPLITITPPHPSPPAALPSAPRGAPPPPPARPGGARPGGGAVAALAPRQQGDVGLRIIAD